MEQEKILVWLPSPMGDAILCTPALRAIRRRFESKLVYFLASPTVKQMLSPSNFNDEWIEYSGRNIFKLSQRLKKENFSTAILFKNSFGSALAAMLAGIDRRIGYSRDYRGIFLTDRIEPTRAQGGKFKAASMVNYYLGITSWLGCEADDMKLELLLKDGDLSSLAGKMPSIFSPVAPLVVLVPGGAFGPSKCWPPKRFAQIADWLIENYAATVAISIAPNKAEKQIAKDIVSAAKNKLYSLADTPLTLGELKSFIAEADLVITNDTGPRHIAIALGKKLITLFGPNNPDWTQTGYENEMQIVGTADCVPCDKPECNQLEHLCMKSITVEIVRAAAEKMLKDTK